MHKKKKKKQIMNEQLYTTILNWSLSNVNIYLKKIVTKLCKNNKLLSYQTLVFMFKMCQPFLSFYRVFLINHELMPLSKHK